MLERGDWNRVLHLRWGNRRKVNRGQAAETWVIGEKNCANQVAQEHYKMGVNRPGVCPAERTEPGSLQSSHRRAS
jgi:hypothetical protein